MAVSSSPYQREHLAFPPAQDVPEVPSEGSFGRLVRLAARLFDVPIAMVSLADADGRWSRSRLGLSAEQAQHEVAFSAQALLGDEVLVIEDARQHGCLADSPLVTGEPFVRFYAAVPVCLPGAEGLGTLCIMDRQPRSLSPDEQAQLDDLAALLVEELQHRRMRQHHLYLFEKHPQPMWVYDVETLRFLDVNAAAREAYGYTREEFLSMTIADIRPEEDGAALRRSVAEAPDHGEHSAGWRHRTRDGRLLDVEVTSYPVTLQGRAARHVQVLDVTERRRAERALQLRDAILEAAGVAAERFLRVPAWRATIDDVLHRLGEAAAVDRVYLFENAVDDEGGLRASQRFEWAAPGVEPQIDRAELQDVSYEDMQAEHWVETLDRHGAVYGSTDTFPEPLAALLRQQNVRSLVIVPVFAGDDWWGFLGFDDCRGRPAWSEPEVEALKVVASTLGAAIHRERTEAALREREESYRNLFDAIPDAVYILDSDRRIVAVNQVALDTYGYEREELIGQRTDVLGAEGLNDYDTMRQLAARAFQGEPQRLNWWGQHPDGEPVPKEVMLNGGTYRGEPVLIVTARDVSERMKAEEQLRRIGAAVDQASDGILVLGASGEVLYENAAQVELTGYTADEVQAQGGGATVYQDADVFDRVLRVMREGGTWQGETTIRHRDGHVVYISMRVDSIHAEDGELVGTLAIHTDVTEQRQAEQAVLQKDEHLGLALEAANMGTWDWDLQTGEITWSDNVHDIIGADRAFDGTYDSYLALVHPDDRPVIEAAVEAALDGHEDYYVEHRLAGADGTTRWFSGRGRVFSGADGEPVRMAGTITDITERKRVREQLALLASYPQLNPEPVIEVDREGRVTYVNPAARTFLAEAAGEAQQLLQELPTLFEAEASGDQLVHEMRLGSAIVELRVSQVPGSELLRAYVHDVTERRQAEDALRESEARARRLALVASRTINGVMITDMNGQVEWVNEGFTKITGYSLGDVQGRHPIPLLCGPDTGAEHTAYLERQMRARETFEIEITNYTRSGEPFYIHIEGQPLFEDDGRFTGYMVLGTDVTERTRAEEALRESEQRLRTIFDRAPLGVVLITPDRTIEQVNTAFCEMLGYDEADLLGYSVNEFTVPDAVPASEQRTAALFSGETDGYQVEKQYVRRDGSRLWMQVTTAILGNGTDRYGLAMFEDVTDRRAHEQQLVEAKEHAEEMNRLKSAFLANMSHEIRTPLTAISGFAEILAEEVQPGNREFVELIRDSSRRLMDTLNSILDLAQLESKAVRLQPARVDMNAALAAMLQPFYGRAAERGLDLRLEVPAQPLEAHLDDAVLERVVRNLVSNALKFTAEGHVAVALSRDARQRIVLRVEDTGVGIAPSFLPHIFEEFQQESSGLTRDYEGTGLGLAITKRLVGLMGGTIEVESTKGVGTSFTLVLPGAEGAREAAADPASAPVRDKPHVLVVEDNVYGGRLMQKLLEKAYHVELATSGEAALELAERHRYDAVLMDISLGSAPDGEEVMRRLRRQAAYADVPMAAVTAHVLPGDEAHLLEAGFDAYVAKPFTRREILDTLQLMLGEDDRGS